jgi:hypothetical protein
LTDPSKELNPKIAMLMIHICCPVETPDASGMALSGAYWVQPDAEAPPSTAKLASITSPDTKNSQYDHMLRRGNAMSCVPIWRGIR